MGEWTPVIAGYGFVILVLVGATLAPNAWWVQELARRYGVRPSGPFGIFTRRDLFVRAGLSGLAAAGCLALSLAASTVMEWIPEYRPGNQVAATYFFGFFLLAGVGVLAAIISLWQAIFYRPRRPPAPFDPHAWHALAELLDRLAVEPIPETEWALFVAHPQSEPALEHVRLACLRLCGGERARFRGALRTQAQSWAGAIRAHAS
jgi:hypothetical protein